LATRVRDNKPKLIRLGPHQRRALKAMLELRLIFGNEIPLKAIQDKVCSDDAKCRKGVTDGLRRLRRRGLVVARGARRGLRYIVTQQLIELYQISKRKRQCFTRTRSTRPVDSAWGTTLRVFKMIVESRGMFTREIEGRLGISRTAVRYQINKLKKLDLIREPFPGYVEPAPLDMERVERALEAAGELRVVLEALGLIYANGRIQLRPFTSKEYAMVKKESLRKAQHELNRLKDEAIIIRLPGRRCRLGFYIVNPIYPVRIPEHIHDGSTRHRYGGSRVWKRRRSSSNHRSCVRVGLGILGDGYYGWRFCRFF
jgi:DNA-binding Lrp family transcriptional regulator